MSLSFLEACASRAVDAKHTTPCERALAQALAEIDTGMELRGTKLTTLPDGLNLSFAPRAREVDLCGNRLEKLPDDLIASGAQLKKFAVARNQLSSLSPCLAEAKCPKLFLQHNQLEALEHLPKLGGLMSLDASYNKLSGALELAEFPTLQKLRLCNNALTTLSVASAPMLSSIDASDNRLTDVPAGLDMSVLTSLCLSGNELCVLPGTLTGCGRLLELDVSCNRLTSLPAALEGLSALRKLSVQRNKLTELPDAIWRMTALLELNASRNRLSALPDAPAAPLGLVELCVAHNALTTFPSALAASLPSLMRLDVGHNMLTSLPMEGLRSLRFLLAHHNLLRDVPGIDDCCCPKLQSVLARGNYLDGLASPLQPPGSSLCTPSSEVEIMTHVGGVPGKLAPSTGHAASAGWRTLVLDVARRAFGGSHRLSAGVALMNGRRRSMEDRATLELSDSAAASASMLRPTPAGSGGAAAGAAAGHTTRIAAEGRLPVGVACLAGVYDGHGGAEVSELIQQVLPQAIHAALAAEQPSAVGAHCTSEAAAGALRTAFSQVAAQLESDPDGTYGWVGSTATVAMLMEGGAAAPAVAAVPGATPLHLVVGNLGDSDAVLLTHPETGERSPRDHPEIGERPWRLVDHLVSTRHRPEERSEEERICSAGGYVSEEGQLNDMIAVSRFLGNTDHPPPRCSTPSVRCVALPVEANWTLVIASDGLWDVLGDDLPQLLSEAESVAARRGGVGRVADADELAASLRDEAFLRGSADNVSVIVICGRRMEDCQSAGGAFA